MSWERVFSLKAAEALDSWPETALSPELQRYSEGARERARKQEEYYRQRARSAAKNKPFLPGMSL
jgi:vacuolar-type H+-ATPase subunit E/Vma4